MITLYDDPALSWVKHNQIACNRAKKIISRKVYELNTEFKKAW
jgi:hypothetical protein